MSISAEKTILALPKVQACKVLYQGEEIDQIYVSAEIPGHSQDERLQAIKSLVRSITGALALEHALEIDYRKVKIVDVMDEEKDGAKPSPAEQIASRIRILSAYIKYWPEPRVVVELGLNGSTYQGTAFYQEADPTRSTVEAFLEAFHSMNLGKAQLLFSGQFPESLAHNRLVILKLRLVDTHKGATELLGIAESKQDLILCTVRACLNALNRKIELCHLQ